MKAMKHQKKYIELEQVIYVTCFDDELWVVYAWYGAMRSNAQECVRNAQRYEQNQYRIGPVFNLTGRRIDFRKIRWIGFVLTGCVHDRGWQCIAAINFVKEIKKE